MRFSSLVSVSARPSTASGPAAAAATVATQHHFFEKHLAPWIGRFFADLETAEHAEFYRPVGTLGRLFIGIETEAFALPL